MADNNLDFISKSLSGLKGLVFGDRGFISGRLFEKLFFQGLKLVTGIRNNMKNKLFSTQEKLLIKKWGVIESVFNILTTVCDLEHTRHRSPANALVNILASVSAYSFLDRKPSMRVHNKLIIK